MADAEDNATGLRGDDKILQEAKKRFKRCMDFEATARKRFLEDIKFDAGDSDNNYQWPEALANTRVANDRPCLTINKTQKLNDQIVNEGKKNKPAIKIIATGGKASFKSAQVYSDLARHMEYKSNAESAYDTALGFAVRGGIGYCHMVSDFVGDNSFDQSLFIRRIKNPLDVYLDPDIEEEDGSDAKFGYIFKSRPREEAERERPSLKNVNVSGSALDGESWVTQTHIREALYYRRVEIKDKLILIVEPDMMPDGVTPNPNAGQESLKKASELPKEILDLVMAGNPKTRPIKGYKVEWYKIIGDEIVDRGVGENALPIPYIPIARCVGKETLIDGEMDRKGHTRALKDPQRMLNYNASGAVEFGALQSKSPWLASTRAIEGYETYWSTANTINHSFLPWNDIDEDNPSQPVTPPTRTTPPQSAPVFMDGMQIAENQMMMVSGQYQSQTGEQENAKTAPAINARQRQGDTATYHFPDAQARMIRHLGRIFIAWAPHVYDTERVLKIMAEDGTERQIKIDPSSPEAVQETENKQPISQDVKIDMIFNPRVGEYDVQADVGPGYATKRQEAANVYGQIAIANPEAMNVMGDYVFKAMDAPYADEIAERWKRKIPADIKGEAPPPEVGMLTMQVENMKSALAGLVQELAEKEIEIKQAKDKGQTDAHRAETDRLKVLSTGMQPQDVLALVQQLVNDALATNVVPQEESDAVMAEPQLSMPMDGGAAMMPPQQGAM